jgi:hypothetical protein
MVIKQFGEHFAIISPAKQITVGDVKLARKKIVKELLVWVKRCDAISNKEHQTLK